MCMATYHIVPTSNSAIRTVKHIAVNLLSNYARNVDESVLALILLHTLYFKFLVIFITVISYYITMNNFQNNHLEVLKMRLHYFDNGRALASLLGFFYHVGLIFSIPWVINSNPNNFSSSLHLFTDFLSLFRMPLFIFIVGYFAIYSVKKYKFGAFAKNKFLRLGVPLLSSLYILVFIQHIYADILFKEESTFIDVLNIVNPLSNTFTLSHLWFLYVVIIYSFILYFIVKTVAKYSSYFKKIKDTLMNANTLKSDILFILLTFGPNLFIVTLYKFYPINHGLLPYQFALYPSYFIMGVFTFIFWDKYSKLFFNLSKKRVSISLIVMISSYIVVYLIGSSGNTITKVIKLFFSTTTSYYSLLLALYILFKFFNKTNKVLKYLADSSYSIYLLHQPIIVVVSYYYFKNIDSPILISYMCILIVSICVSYLIDFLFIRKTKIGKFLFTGVKSQRIPHSSKIEERYVT